MKNYYDTFIVTAKIKQCECGNTEYGRRQSNRKSRELFTGMQNSTTTPKNSLAVSYKRNHVFITGLKKFHL